MEGPMRRLLLLLLCLLLPGIAGAQDGGYIQFWRANFQNPYTSNIELRNPASLAAESLSNPTDFAATWAADGAICVVNAGSVKCTGPGTGTFTQTSANATIPWASVGANGPFIYAPTISNVAGTPACTVTTAFAAAATAIPNVSASTQVIAKAATVGDFVTQCVLGAGATIWFDAVSLKQITGGSLTVQGRVLVGSGTAALPAIAAIANPGTGIWFDPGSQIMTVSTGGVGRINFFATSLYPTTTDAVALGSGTQSFTTANLTRGIQGSKSKSLTDAGAAVAVIRVPVASNGYQAGEVIWNCQSTDATDYRTTAGRIRFAAISKAAAPTCTVNVVGTDLTASSNGNTLVCTWTNVVNSTNCDLSVACVDNTAGTQTMTINFRPDMPTTATLVYP
jgi:hypothetical protein